MRYQPPRLMPMRAVAPLAIGALLCVSGGLWAAAADPAADPVPRAKAVIISDALLRGIADPNRPQVKALRKARQAGQRAQFDQMATPAPFDDQAFDADATTYLATTEPARVYQTHAPAAAVPRLTAVGGSLRLMASATSVVLEVQATPGAPVSFLATNGGIFYESTLSSVTVQADTTGRAQVTYIATIGTQGIATVTAGSPRSVGTVTFLIHIEEPNASSASNAENP